MSESTSSETASAVGSTFTLTIELGNDAMQAGEHIAWALKRVGDVLSGLTNEDVASLAGRDGAIRDTNGNTVGKWSVTT